MSKGRTWLGRLHEEYLVGCGAHDSRLFDAGGDQAGSPEILNLTSPPWSGVCTRNMPTRAPP